MMAQGRAALVGVHLVSMWESRNPVEINGIINDADVLPFICKGPPQPVDVTEHLRDPRNRFFCRPGAGVCFEWRGPGTYEAHFFARKGVRGARVLELCRFSLDRIFQGDAERVWGQIHVANRAACLMARKAGLRSLGVVQVPHGYGGPLRDLEMFMVERADWHPQALRLVA